MRVDDVEAAHRSRRPETETKKKNPLPNIRVILAVAVAVLLLLWIGWYFLHNRPEEQSEAQQQAAALSAASSSKPTKPAAAPAPAPATKSAQPAKTSAPSPDKARGQWRVIAYTYNREKDAQKKQSALSRKHPGLQAEVFTPNGRAPYLVTLGGWMSQEEAFALAKRARSEGLPRDTYATNAP
jgi:cytoskeletal protein RodZ